MNDVLIRTKVLPHWIDDKYFKGTDLATVEDLIGVIEDIKDDRDFLQDEYDNYKQYVKDNYKYMEQKEQIGYDERTW